MIQSALEVARVSSIHCHSVSAWEDEAGPVGGRLRSRGCVRPARITVSIITSWTVVVVPGMVST